MPVGVDASIRPFRIYCGLLLRAADFQQLVRDDVAVGQGDINAVADLEATLKLARIMDESELSNDTASIGMHVKILAEGDDLEDAEEYDLTGSTEADMDLNRISDESPVGAALIGCKVGDSVDVTLPNGNIITYKLLEVSRSK